MGIWDRLGQVLKSYLNDDDSLYRDRHQTSYNDPDLNSAFDELNDFLNKDKPTEDSGTHTEYSGTTARMERKNIRIPEELRPDFNELNVPFGASADECKEAYKKLLKIHHPDRHVKHEGNYHKATNKTARINAAYERIAQWRSKNQGAV